MSRCIYILLALVSLFAVTTCTAAAPDDDGLSLDSADADVTIIEGATRTVYEYRQNGQLRMIRVVPKFGRPYYLVPADPTRGNGDLEHSGPLVPSWHVVEF